MPAAERPQGLAETFGQCSAFCCNRLFATAFGSPTMTSTNAAAAAGTFMLGGEKTINRLGFGAMRITGKGIWGPPRDRDEALRVLKALPELQVDFIDTADSYGPDTSEKLIREALHPYKNIVVATKGGLTRPGPDQWLPKGDPAYLVAQAKKSREQLGVEQIELWQLHRIDPKVNRDEQFAAVKELLDTKVIRYAGLSEVNASEIEAASKYFKVATVQNKYNLTDRASEATLEYCEKHGIGFIPWFPLAAGSLATAARLEAIAKTHSAKPGQIALAWLLHRSPVMLPIPGTSSVAHLKENVAAAAITLTDAEFKSLSA